MSRSTSHQHDEGEQPQFQARHLPHRSVYYTTLDGTPDLRWTLNLRPGSQWEHAETVVNNDEAVTVGIGDLSDQLRAAICAAYGSHRQHLPTAIFHYTLAVNERVNVGCQECGATGRNDDTGGPCEECGGSGDHFCRCEECDERVCETRDSVLARARSTYWRWYRGLNTAGAWEASHFEEAYDELGTRPERLAAELAETIEYLTPANAESVPEFAWLLEKAQMVGYEVEAVA